MSLASEGRAIHPPGWPLDLRALPVFFALLLMTFAFSLGYVWTGDLWWYLASGGEILRLGSIPSFDPFVYSLPEPAKWVTHSWLWTVILSWLEGRFGLWALPFAGTLLTGAIVTLIFTRARLDRFGLVNGLLTALVVLVASHRFALRAELPGWLLLVVFIRTFDRVGPFSLRGAILLASAQWLWSNLHGGFTLGILTALAYGVGGFIQNRWSKSRRPVASSDRRASEPPTLPLWVIPLLVVVSLGTPDLAGQRLADAIQVTSRFFGGPGSDASLPIVEWRSTFSPGFISLQWAYAVFLCGGGASFLLARSPRRIARLLLFAGMAILGAWAVRFFTGFAITAALVTMANLRDAKRPRLAPGRSSRIAVLHAFSTLCLCLVMSATGIATWESRAQFELGQSEDHFFSLSPRYTCPGAADYILAHALPGPIFNEMGLGGYLIYRLHPGRQLFIDGRLLDRSLVDDYRNALGSRERWERLTARHRFRTVVLSNLLEPSLPLRTWLAQDPAWEIAYLDPQAVVFVRNDAVPEPPERAIYGRGGEAAGIPFAAASRLLPRRWMEFASRPLLRQAPFDLLNVYLGALSELGLHPEVEALSTRVLKTVPDAAGARAFRGYARLEQGRPLEAVSDLRRAVEEMPKGIFAILNYALALNRIGHGEAALRQLQKAERLDSSSPQVQRVQRELRGHRVSPRR